MENILLYVVLLSNFIHDAIGGENCEATSQSSTITQYCEVGGCCIPNNMQRLTKDSDLCCVNFLVVILIGVFVGLPIFILTGICLVIIIKTCVKNRKQTSLTALSDTENHLPQFQPKPPDYSQAVRTCPVYSPSRAWQQRPSLVIPGAISHRRTSQHLPSEAYNTDQSHLPTSPPPPYASRASGCVSPIDLSGSQLSVLSEPTPEPRGFTLLTPTPDQRRNGSSTIATADPVVTDLETSGDNDLAFI
ncbi:uncharacterized protein LOC132553922 [Ylistrum balloti]|uniref:uncharacterized protein LOC132553922 n=1 Tax=Ylistrum balloti TaxID=509963 RepID=UPI002905A98E|nr:uncharacterized protein LOC132553922 [Ylistrum balloti]